MDAQPDRHVNGDAPHTRRPADGAVSVDFEAGPEAAAWARNALFPVEQQVDEDVMADVRLLVSELVTNSVRHSGVAPPDSRSAMTSK